MRGLLKQDIALAAIYRVGAVRGFDRTTLIRLMVDRAGMQSTKAGQLADHWMRSEPYRTKGQPSSYFKPRSLESAS